MSSDPFVPPRSALVEPPRPPGSAIKGVLAGLVIDVGGSFVAQMIVGIGVTLVLVRNGMSEQGMRDLLTGLQPWSPLGLALLVPGLACSYLGGYACARIARRPTLRPALILAALSAAFGLYMSDDNAGPATTAVLTALDLAAVMSGAWQAWRRQPPPPAATPTAPTSAIGPDAS
jgi:hypothetical protein